MLLSDDSVVLAATAVVPVPDVVVVNGAPLKAIVPPPVNDRSVFSCCVKLKLPPDPVVNVAVVPAPGAVITIGKAPPESKLRVEAAVAEMGDMLLKFKLGVLTCTVAPEPIDTVEPALKVIEEAAAEVDESNTVPPAPASRV